MLGGPKKTKRAHKLLTDARAACGKVSRMILEKLYLNKNKIK